MQDSRPAEPKASAPPDARFGPPAPAYTKDALLLSFPTARRRLRHAVWVALSTFGLAVAPPAHASTAIEGDLDANAPLVIDPSTTPSDPQTAEIKHGGYPTVGFLQSMPATRMVSRVTIGDVGRGTGCPSPTGVHLLVNEHVGGDLRASAQIRNSVVDVPLPTTPGKVSFNIQPTLFRKGRGYSFQLVQSASCPLARTTWAHNEPTIDGGSTRCAAGPPAPVGSIDVAPRMWHETGQADRIPLCVSRPESWAFDPSMPTGWLVPEGRWIRTGAFKDTQPPGPTNHAANCGASEAAHGAKLIYWRPHPTTAGWSEYVCMWPQYEPLEQTVDDGWYFGIPWTSNGTGAPRDVYIKLETIDYDTLLQRHVPILKYDSGEDFHVVSPGALTDFYVPGGLFDLSNSLKDDQGEFAISNPAFGDSLGWSLDKLTLDYMHPTYPSGEVPPSSRSGTAADDGDFLSARGNDDDGHYDDDAREMELRTGYPYKVYGRVAHGSDGKIWLQYWFFYYFNPDPFGQVGPVHEGDWEMIQVGLKPDLTPDDAAYAHHEGGQVCDWSDVERAGDIPVVYVAQHSHASFFGPGEIPFPYSLYDRADGLGGGLFLADLEQVRTADPAWVAWPGKWGDSGASPRGPAFQGAKWSDPSSWAGGLAGC